MGSLNFRIMERQEYKDILPHLFHILHTNMSFLAPTGCTYEEDRDLWLSYILPELKSGNKQIMLMVLENSVVGYAQYSIIGDTLEMDEVEILPRYQRTKVFYRFCQYMTATLPKTVQFVSSYVRKDNLHSISIHEKLGMERMSENKSGTSWFYRGERKNAQACFRR